MSEYQFIQDPSNQWIIFSPHRAKRPDAAHQILSFCPFCIGNEKEEQELYRIGGHLGDANWKIRVLPNKFPFAPSHELIIHSPDHHKTFDELSLEHIVLLLHVYRDRFQVHQQEGLVYIFYNHGFEAGQSQPHPHTQLVVIPSYVTPSIPQLNNQEQEIYDIEYFQISCPLSSHWPDEIWISPKARNKMFGDITDYEIKGFAFVLQRIIMLLNIRHGNEFPYNFYIYPGNEWYLRIIPRFKSLGGFEIGTHIDINTEDPKETIAFIKEHFANPNEEKIKKEHRATYRRGV